MDRREKTEFILEQVELCIERGDFTQAAILGRKISTKYLNNPEVSDLKLKFYDQQIQLAKQDEKYLDVCKHYRAVYDTPSVVEDPLKLKSVSTYQPRVKETLILTNHPRSLKESFSTCVLRHTIMNNLTSFTELMPDRKSVV